jgi:lysophospholipase L1-like esterase
MLAAAITPSARALGGDGLLSILVMGDSYSAGNGAGQYAGAKHCRQSAHNYGRTLGGILVAPPYGQPTFVQTVACSGDVAAAFATPQAGRPPQLAAIRRSDDLILLTIGGNDLGFSAIVQYCLVHRFRVATTCDARLTTARRMLADGTMERRLRGVLAGIVARTDPAATIVLLGYPYLEARDDYALHHGHTTYDVGRKLRALEDAGDALEQSVAGAIDAEVGQSVLFVATKSTFAGHELSAGSGPNDGRWFVKPWSDAGFLDHDVWYHPNRLGWKHEAALLASDPRIPKSDWTSVVGGPFGLSGCLF